MTDDALFDTVRVLLAIAERGGADGLRAAYQARALTAVLMPRIDRYESDCTRCDLALDELRALPAK